MSRARARSRTGRPPSGGLLQWVLSLPARMHLRWLVILVVLTGAMGIYAHVLTTAPPMPPSQAPAETGTAATGGVVTAHSPATHRTAPSKAPARSEPARHTAAPKQTASKKATHK